MKKVAFTTKEIYWMKFLCNQWITSPQKQRQGPTQPAIRKFLSKLVRQTRRPRRRGAEMAVTERVFRDHE